MTYLQAGSSSERSTWLSHIQEATNAFKSRENRYRTTNHGSNISFVHNIQQKFENNMDLTERRAPRELRTTQSFNEQSLRQRELLARPLPSPPVEKGVEDQKWFSVLEIDELKYFQKWRRWRGRSRS